MVCFFTSYHKGFRHSQQGKTVFRFLPRPAGELLIRYIWLVLPFWQQVKGIALQASKASPFIWTDNIVQLDLPAVERRLPQQQGWYDNDNTAQRAVQLWSGDKMRRILTKHANRLMGTDLNIAIWRNLAISISRRYLRGNGFDESDYNTDVDIEEAEFDLLGSADDINDKQSGHSSYVAGLAYGRDAQQGNIGLALELEQFWAISVRWHRLLGFNMTGSAAGKKRPYEAFEVDQQTIRLQRLARLSQVSIYTNGLI